MKIVTVVCSCLSLCLWADLGFAASSPIAELLLDHLFIMAQDLESPQFEKVLTLAKPCLEQAFAEMDPAALESAYVYYTARRQCQLQSKGEATERKQRAKYATCVETAPSWRDDHMKTVGDAYKACLKAAAKTQKTSLESDVAFK